MKRFIFLFLIAFFLVSLMPAMEIAYPPWAHAQSIALPGYGVENLIVTPATVLTIASLSAWQQVSLSALPATMIINAAGQPQGYYLIKPICTVQGAVTGYFTRPGYWLRL